MDNKRIARELVRIAKEISSGMRVNSEYLFFEGKMSKNEILKELYNIIKGKPSGIIEVSDINKGKREAKEIIEIIKQWGNFSDSKLVVKGFGSEWIPLWG